MAVIMMLFIFCTSIALADIVKTHTCKLCHRISTKKLVQGYEISSHSKTMQDAKRNAKIVADFKTNKAFARSEVAYIIGKGRKVQAFLDSEFRVLPSIWDNSAKKWASIPSTDARYKCLGCHSTEYDAKSHKYTEVAVGCKGCHGPGHRHLGKSKRIVNPAKLSEVKQAMVCGQCHSSGKDKSGKFAFPVGYIPGGDLASTYVQSGGICPAPNTEYADFMKSNHYRKGTTCVTCHEPHGKTTEKLLLRKPANSICAGCHSASGKASKHLCNGHGNDCIKCHMPGGRHVFAKSAEK